MLGPSARGPDDSPLGEARRVRDSLLISLTFSTGIVDVLSYLGLGQIFTANMTGNTIFLAIALGQGNALTAARSVVALLGFALGALVSGARLEPATGRSPWPRVVTRMLWAELALVGVLSVLWWWVGGHPDGPEVYALIGVSAVGMGVQSAVGRKLAVPGVSTNVLTMAMTGLMAELAAVGISGPNVRRWGAAILAMGSGAALGAALFLFDRPLLPFPVMLVLAGVCIVASLRFRETDSARATR